MCVYQQAADNNSLGVSKMQKLIDALKINVCEANIIKVAKHLKKHPMAVCMLLPEEQRFLISLGLNLND